jgi:hypothetical protein
MIQQEVRSDFDTLLATVQSPAAEQQTAGQMERHLFKALLQLGAHLLLLFLLYRSQRHQRQAVYSAEGERIPYHSERQRRYYSVFGCLTFARPYFYRRSAEGRSPLDAALGLAADCYSDFLRELHEELCIHVPYEKTQQFLGRLLDIRLSKRVQQQFVVSDASDVEAYYEQKDAPAPELEEVILVAQADGKGVPMVRPSKTSHKVRLRRGEARSRKKTVVVTALYTIAPAPRTAEDVLQTLLQKEADEADTASPARYRPQHKEIRGTLQGKDVALQRLAQQIAKRDGTHIQHRVALCDGDHALQAKLGHYLPDFTLILDFIHAYEYLWKAAGALWGEKHPERLPWMQHQTRRLLTSHIAELITYLRQRAQETERTAHQQKTLHKVANYFEKNQPYMDYATYLQKGWPIASGVIEGACRHFVKDRMELSGMRWTQGGAEDLLGLRAVAENDDWDAYHRFRRQRRQQRLYGCHRPTAPANGEATAPSLEATIVVPSEPTHPLSDAYRSLPLAA